MKLEKLLERMDYKVLAGSTDIEISTLAQGGEGIGICVHIGSCVRCT